MMEPKRPLYLSYPIDKHQESPTLYYSRPAPGHGVWSNCDDGFDVLVDLENGTRYFCGQWRPVDYADHTALEELALAVLDHAGTIWTGPQGSPRCAYCHGSIAIGLSESHHTDNCPVQLAITALEER
jgi:hypothetical protein